MRHPGASVTLLQASPALPGRVNEVDVVVHADLTAAPRTFVHWPSDLTGANVDAGARVLTSIVRAQLLALQNGATPTLGDNRDADPSLPPGRFF